MPSPQEIIFKISKVGDFVTSSVVCGEDHDCIDQSNNPPEAAQKDIGEQSTTLTVETFARISERAGKASPRSFIFSVREQPNKVKGEVEADVS